MRDNVLVSRPECISGLKTDVDMLMAAVPTLLQDLRRQNTLSSSATAIEDLLRSLIQFFQDKALQELAAGERPTESGTNDITSVAAVVAVDETLNYCSESGDMCVSYAANSVQCSGADPSRLSFMGTTYLTDIIAYFEVCTNLMQGAQGAGYHALHRVVEQ